jgi:hypothetical protein
MTDYARVFFPGGFLVMVVAVAAATSADLEVWVCQVLVPGPLLGLAGRWPLLAAEGRRDGPEPAPLTRPAGSARLRLLPSRGGRRDQALRVGGPDLDQQLERPGQPADGRVQSLHLEPGRVERVAPRPPPTVRRGPLTAGPPRPCRPGPPRPGSGPARTVDPSSRRRTGRPPRYTRRGLPPTRAARS